MYTAIRIAAVVAALTLGTTLLAVEVGGPPEAAPQPGAPTPEDSVMVTGSQVEFREVDDPSPGVHWSARREGMSDPRLDGEVRFTFDEDHHGEEPSGAKQEPHVVWGTITVTNDEGSWQGHSLGFIDELNVRRQMAWFEGHGAYEGLAFIEQFGNPVSGRMDLVGFLFEGELPAVVLPAPGPVTE